MKELSLHILDIVMNSVEAGSRNISIEVGESESDNKLSLVIKDDGRGIPGDMVKNVTDPWITSRKVRKVGMGLPLLHQQAEAAGGCVVISSRENMGTIIKAEFRLDHIDRQPLGDIPGILKILIGTTGSTEFTYRHSTDRGSYSFSTREAKEILGMNELNDYTVLEQIRDMIKNNLEIINADLN